MFQKIVILLNLLSFTCVISQPLFYLLALANAQKTLRPSAYIELRNLLDRKLLLNLRVVYYTTICTNLFLIFVSLVTDSNLLLATSLVAAAALFADMMLLYRGDIPINKPIQPRTPENYPPDWKSYPNNWFFYYHRRQIVDIIGFLSLLTGAIFG